MNRYRLEGDIYIIREYDKLPPFSSFLPGLAGKKGIPLWVFYTNRGQGVNSFGIHNKDNAIMEFNPANTAYENAGIKGYRTFIKSNGKVFEPFREPSPAAERNFYIHRNSFQIEECNREFGLKITVRYFVLPHNSVGALVRKVIIENLDQEEKRLEVLDGLPKIIPYGIKNSEYKEMSNLLKSWTEVQNTEKNIPYYTLRSSSSDSAEVSDIEGGYFYLGILNGEVQPVIYDAEAIFDYDTSLVYPISFLQHTLQEIMDGEQCYYNKIPCGFTPFTQLLKGGEKCEFASLTGFAGSIVQLNEKAGEFCEPDFIPENEAMAEELADQLTADIRTHSGEPLFDKYMEQNYLDNFLRGGYPFVFGSGNQKSVVHLFSRKHGDPERDYNFFSIAGEYYSQGNGNFRDVSQNRRNDVFFCKEIGNFDVRTFYELIQIDGYNPLEVRPSTFTVRPDCTEAAERLVRRYIDHAEPVRLINLLKENFTPGQIANRIARDQLKMTGDEDEFLEELLKLCYQNIEAGFDEGYWSDHWDYNMDLIDSYLSIFPEKRKELLFEDNSYRFYDSPARVLPRSEKYVINKNGEPRQYGALVRDEEKLGRLRFDKKGTNWLRTGDGDYARTTLLGKMITLTVNKFSSLDPYGMGVEMEGGKPGWNDAMNGLPGLFGSGMAETLELQRMISFLADTLKDTDPAVNSQHAGAPALIELPVQLHHFLFELAHVLEQSKAEDWSDFQYWDAATTLREQFREQVRFTLDGTGKAVSTDRLAEILASFLAKLEEGIKKACTYGDGIVPTYFTYEATEFAPVYDQAGNRVLSGYGLPGAEIRAFRVKPLPAFLEGPAKLLSSLKSTPEARELYRKVKESELYDTKLGMYKTSVPIGHISMENGRIRAFTPGWLERESIFLHMEYKYLLSILRAGLYEQFFEDIRTGMVVFRDPQEYGRSTLENSSFLASGVNPNAGIRGRGYVARLSGSTTEAVSIWIGMFIGERIFTWENGVLILNFDPKLPGWMFDEKGEAAFTLLSCCRVTYHNPSRKETYGKTAAQIKRIVISDTKEEFTGNRITGIAAEKIRNGEVNKIDAYLEE